MTLNRQSFLSQQPKTDWQPKTAKIDQRGDTMIEVLIAIVIISLGVLGVIGLQTSAFKSISSSHSISVAAMAAEDFGDRMRANPNAAANYLHNIAPNSEAVDCSTTSCTPTQLAAYDISQGWKQIGKALPAGKLEVASHPSGAAKTYLLTVRWDEDRSGSFKTNCPTKSNDDLDCQQFKITL